MKLGMIGLNKNNGHPYSFSSIINGYDPYYLKKSGWDVIFNYLSKRSKKEFGIKDVNISHVWTQNLKTSNLLSKACFINNICADFTEMIGKVDGVIIARDDWKNHYKFSHEFLKKGIKVFIDKPLTLNKNELNFFTKYLRNNCLMSCSGLRYSTELKNLKKKIDPKSTRLIIANIHKDLEKYGVHMLEAIYGIGKGFNRSKLISKLPSRNKSFYIKLSSGVDVYLNCLGNVKKTINLKILTNKNNYDIDMFDNFGAFKETLINFVKFVKVNKHQFDPNETINIMNTLIKASKINDIKMHNI
tara:strand:+ start:936 stop:1838 length:903 start_codon:yes stop_codon:yes gene_type:complete